MIVPDTMKKGLQANKIGIKREFVIDRIKCCL
jgi:hypothetical protein